MIEFALIGATASGKSELGMVLADRFNANILSLDSLSIYKEIDIASAKPSKLELEAIKHYGVNEIYPDEHFNAALFFKLYEQAKNDSQKLNKNLIIVGGTSFYLKALTIGLSKEPQFCEQTLEIAKEAAQNLEQGYSFICQKDPNFASSITKNDFYRIEKWHKIFFQTGKSATQYFSENKQEPIIKNLPIFEIETKRTELKERIAIRTKKMIQNGLLEEVELLEQKYSREPKSFKSIGIKEVFEYFDGKINKEELENKISSNTAALAKRQTTFNRTQFITKISLPKDRILEVVENTVFV